MNIELRHFRLISAIVEKKSLSGASKILHQTPSALSYQLKEAELQVGIPLFNRVGRKMVLTSIGERFLSSSKIILQELDVLTYDIKQLNQDQRGTIRISTECHTTYYWLPLVLRKFSQHYPHVKIDVRYNSTEDPLSLLFAGELDMMISYTYKQDKNIRQIELFRDEMLAIMAADHFFTQKAHLEAVDFTQVTLITHASSLEQTNIYEELLKDKKLSPKDIIHIPFTEAAIALVKEGIGIMVLPKWMLTPYYKEQNLVFKSITAEGTFRNQHLLVLNNTRWPDYYDLFIDYMQEELTRRD